MIVFVQQDVDGFALRRRGARSAARRQTESEHLADRTRIPTARAVGIERVGGLVACESMKANGEIHERRVSESGNAVQRKERGDNDGSRRLWPKLRDPR